MAGPLKKKSKPSPKGRGQGEGALRFFDAISDRLFAPLKCLSEDVVARAEHIGLFTLERLGDQTIFGNRRVRLDCGIREDVHHGDALGD